MMAIPVTLAVVGIEADHRRSRMKQLIDKSYMVAESHRF